MRSDEVLEGLAAVGKVGELGGGQRQFLGELDRLLADLLGDLAEGGLEPTCPTSTQMSIRSSASGQARRIDSWRLETVLET